MAGTSFPPIFGPPRLPVNENHPAPGFAFGGRPDRRGAGRASFSTRGSAAAVEALEVQGPVSSQNVINILDSAIALLTCGVDGADPEIAQRLLRLGELLARTPAA